jgi:PleD family two-component response regulator
VTDAEWLQIGSVGESTILEAKEHRNCCALPRNEPSRFPHFSHGANKLARSNMRKRMQQNADEGETLYGTPKILIFDVDIDDLTRHSEPFEAHGFEVHKCMSVETAMRCVEREELDFALLDQGSPTFEGLRVIRHLVRYNVRTPFVVVTRCKDMLCRQEAFALGAMDYLEKPVPIEEMNWIIRNYFGSSLKI